MSIWGACTPALMTVSMSDASATVPPRWVSALRSRVRDYGYALAVALAAIALIVALPGSAPSAEEAYAPLALAVLVGLLLTVRLAPGRPAAAMVLIPAMVFDQRFGLAALWAVAYVGVVAGINALGKETVLEGRKARAFPLRFVDGVVFVGPLKVAQVPPLF